MGQGKKGKEEKERRVHGYENCDPKKASINEQTFQWLERNGSNGARPQRVMMDTMHLLH
jgi:hypothetical protein